MRFGVFSRLARDASGTTALEFALIGTIFLGLMLVVVSLGEWFFFQTNLDLGVYRAARNFTTGTAQAAGTTAASFEPSYLCPNLVSFFGCAASDVTVNIVAINAANTSPTCTGSSCITTTSCVTDPVTKKETCSTALQPLQKNFCLPGRGQVVYLQANTGNTTLPFIVPISVASSSIGSFLSGATVKIEPVPNLGESGC